MYFVNAIEKLNQQFAIGFIWSKKKLNLKKYFQYFLIMKGDRRWLLMFIIARTPLGRTLGRFICGDQPIVKKQNYGRDREKSIFQDLKVETVVDSIKKDGYYLGLQLPEQILKEILAYANTANISIDGEEGFEFKYSDKNEAARQYNREILTGNYLAVNSECLGMKKLVNDPKLREIATRYLGKEPMLVRSQMSWTFIGSSQAYAQKGEIGSPMVLFHYDLDDYHTLKFFFYLTDTDSNGGSHRCVKGSHKKRKLLHYILRRQSDQAIADYYGAESIVDICGQAGFGFAEDPFCFHRGSPPATAPRLMIQLEFAWNDYGIWKL
jgi:hypothetical protein